MLRDDPEGTHVFTVPITERRIRVPENTCLFFVNPNPSRLDHMYTLKQYERDGVAEFVSDSPLTYLMTCRREERDIMLKMYQVRGYRIMEVTDGITPIDGCETTKSEEVAPDYYAVIRTYSTQHGRLMTNPNVFLTDTRLKAEARQDHFSKCQACQLRDVIVEEHDMPVEYVDSVVIPLARIPF